MYELFELVVSCRFVPSYKRNCIYKFNQMNPSRVEEGSNTSTVVLRIVRGDKKGSLENLTKLNMAASLTGLGPENDCAGED
jgi:hypothetical protein